MTHKYHAVKTVVDGVSFDSKREANRYRELLLLKRAGVVKDVQLQPEYELMPGFTHHASGKRIRPTKYIADFLITYADGHQEIEDTKGVRTEAYNLKKKMFMHRYPDLQIKEV
ncbi:DUF1064 domain-containing protein [Paenibacillus sp. HN-1]|uniref:DUF1064 domain-containing protein n=1 Tax=Paenibacillus TaxID=44249 RepID=UPI001CA9C5AD|nr:MULTISPECIES: DUF1064 domain-containing protein [Paenibacillus]MBY9081218.1 DUF1064 domain-containing protein [Paenibacillus sp. CGMCC 1.18879]MBY9087255.1 DUF1064 domain-containing protein [Paenibacillus sinensis]